jgi:hypothetical protein
VHLEIDRSDIRSARIVESGTPTELADGQVVMRLERAALTSNNVSYALSGDMLDYWGFFPTEAGWGRLPVMGFGIVTVSKHAEIAVGGRYFGFFPLGDHHVVTASTSRGGFIDAAPWREKHAMAYRSFERAEPTPHDDAILILRGLFLTSYLLEDFLREREYFNAEQVIITSASSKTSIALAHCVQRGSDLAVIGLTSPKNVEFTSQLGEYDSVFPYDEFDAIARVPSIVVDMAGNPTIVGNVHHALAGSVRYSCSVGATHWNADRAHTNVPPPRPEFFFAPSQLAKRGKELGRDELNRRINEALGMFIDGSTRWMTVQQTIGATAIRKLYDDLVSGRVDPSVGNIVSAN